MVTAFRTCCDDRFGGLCVLSVRVRGRRAGGVAAGAGIDAGVRRRGSAAAPAVRLGRMKAREPMDQSRRFLGSRQVVRHWILIPAFVGSITPSPATSDAAERPMEWADRGFRGSSQVW